LKHGKVDGAALWADPTALIVSHKPSHVISRPRFVFIDVLLLATTDKFVSRYTDKAVQVTPSGGFTLSTMPDPREVTVIDKQYAVTADERRKLPWETENASPARSLLVCSDPLRTVPREGARSDVRS
jgi:hypothetical protein